MGFGKLIARVRLAQGDRRRISLSGRYDLMLLLHRLRHADFVSID
jgi:hypothetical protein